MSDNNTKNAATHITVSPQEIVSKTLRYWYILAAVVVLSLVITTIYTLVYVTPMYKSTAKLYIVNKESEHITTTDFSLSYYISQDFAEIIAASPDILGPVSSDVGNRYSVTALKNCITVTKPEATRIIEISALTPSAADSKKIVDSICKHSEVYLLDEFGLDQVKVICEGNLPAAPTSPNLTNNLVYAFLIAVVGFELVIILNLIFNNKISTAADIEKYLDLNILATIPYNSIRSKVKTKL